MKAIGLALSFVLISTGCVLGHSWYPPECCGGQDCRPTAPCTQENGRPGLIDGDKCIEPDWSKVHEPASPDGQYHICTMHWFDAGGAPHTEQLCIFRPGAGAA